MYNNRFNVIQSIGGTRLGWAGRVYRADRSLMKNDNYDRRNERENTERKFAKKTEGRV